MRHHPWSVRWVHWDALTWEEMVKGTHGGVYIILQFNVDIPDSCHFGRWMLHNQLPKLPYGSQASVRVLVKAAVRGTVEGAGDQKMVRLVLWPMGGRAGGLYTADSRVH